MKTKSKIFLAQVGRNVCLATILFAIPLFFSTKLINSFRLPKNTLFIILTIGALFFTIMYLLEKKSIDWKKYKFIFILASIYLLLKITSWAFSTYKDVSFWGAYNRAEGLLLWMFIILFFILILLNEWDKEKLKYFSLVIVISTICLGGYGILQKYGLLETTWSSEVTNRIISTMGNPLNLSSYLILSFPFFYFAFVFYKNIFIKILIIAGALLTLLTLYFTQSRSSWISFLFAIAVFIAFYFYKKNKKIIFVSLILVGIISASVFAYIGVTNFDKFQQPVLKRLFSIFNPEDLSNRQRLLFWEGSWDAFKQKPIFGWGSDSIDFAFDKNYPAKLTDLPETHIDRAHNWHLDILVMEGPLVWLFTMFIFIFSIWKAVGLLKNTKPEYSSFGLMYIYIMAACLLQFFFIFALISSTVIIVFSLGVILSISYQTKAEPLKLESRTLKKLKKNSNLYLVIGIGFTAFILFIALKPIIANKELTKALFLQKNLKSFMHKAANIMPSPFYRQQLGTLYLKYANEGRVNNDNIQRSTNANKAVEIYKRLSEQYPDYYLNYRFLAEAYDLQQNYKLTDETFQKAIDLFPKRHNIYWKWGDFLQIRGENEKAIEIYQKAIEIDPDIALPYYELAQLYKKLDDQEKSEEYRQIAIDKGLIPNFLTEEMENTSNASEQAQSATDEISQ